MDFYKNPKVISKYYSGMLQGDILTLEYVMLRYGPEYRYHIKNNVLLIPGRLGLKYKIN